MNTVAVAVTVWWPATDKSSRLWRIHQDSFGNQIDYKLIDFNCFFRARIWIDVRPRLSAPTASSIGSFVLTSCAVYMNLDDLVTIRREFQTAAQAPMHDDFRDGSIRFESSQTRSVRSTASRLTRRRSDWQPRDAVERRAPK